jgi:hypothetical protein
MGLWQKLSGAQPTLPLDLTAAVAKHTVLYDQAGKVTCPGIAYGKVHRVTETKHLETFPEHGTLLAETLELLRILPKAAAILAWKYGLPPCYDEATPGDAGRNAWLCRRAGGRARRVDGKGNRHVCKISLTGKKIRLALAFRPSGRRPINVKRQKHQ